MLQLNPGLPVSCLPWPRLFRASCHHALVFSLTCLPHLISCPLFPTLPRHLGRAALLAVPCAQGHVLGQGFPSPPILTTPTPASAFPASLVSDLAQRASCSTAIACLTGLSLACPWALRAVPPQPGPRSPSLGPHFRGLCSRGVRSPRSHRGCGAWPELAPRLGYP